MFLPWLGRPLKMNEHYLAHSLISVLIIPIISYIYAKLFIKNTVLLIGSGVVVTASVGVIVVIVVAIKDRVDFRTRAAVRLPSFSVISIFDIELELKLEIVIVANNNLNKIVFSHDPSTRIIIA